MMENDKKWMQFSQWIALTMQAKMKEQHLSQKAIAEAMGCKQQYISKILKGEANLSLESICKIEDALGIELLVHPDKNRVDLKERAYNTLYGNKDASAFGGAEHFQLVADATPLEYGSRTNAPFLPIDTSLFTEQDMNELRSMLVRFMNEIMQRELDRLMDQGELSAEHLQELGNTHLRTHRKEK